MTDDALMKARYRRITRFAARYLVQAWWFELFLPRFGLGWISARGRTRRLERIAQRFHVLAVDLGGLMIKVGQFMSSRLDVLPPSITKQLEGLQDEVPAVPFAQMRARAEQELGMPLERAFASVDERPLAAASLGQAHRAVLTEDLAAETGLSAVVLKIQRPGIDRIVDVDLRALRKVGVWLSKVALVRDRVDMPSLVEEFAVTSLEEIDYLHEAANSERFAADFGGEGGVAVPEVVWERTTRRVLTLQDVTAIKINDVDALRAAGIDPAEVAARFAQVMFDQLFDDGFFHADPHPGNVFVTPLPGTTDAGTPAWRFTFIDFGMMGEVPPSLRRGLRRVLIAAASRDGKGLVDGIRDVGVLLPSADTIQLERAMTQLFSRFGGMGFAELQEVDPREFRAFAIEFGDVVRSLPFQLPENFLLIVRAMSLTSGMCSALDPAFNIWDAVEPYAQRLIREESGNTAQAFVREVGAVAAVTARLPRRADNLISRFEDGSVSVQTPRIERRMRDLERMVRRVVSSVLFTGLLIGGVLLQSEQAVLGTILMVVSIAPLSHALLAGWVARRNGA
ncbi:putative unusual protein kinase regulating ubiquinone biosynthesis (AarF/ABC1/UbiB family) [Microbacterium testaceum]|uniref:ABC1 kinase family protein n=1 Tax=Microbacterium TaxID=33882 RepID=UPI001AE7B6BA|nr:MULTISPECIES: AarF/UbiB family protein [Microbacterium]MDQ1113482.1 putative unusual protein kinase regulating ubiquinone biosynthesis (AarF/ABC1/UbiB family) [Microbacterium testaceum]MDR6099417.1 putative unusual protein kinase regulating ubiquinone biosynthesis (AarF/ABC1/UbiB family) [Microbacterium sp. SORGH_AS_0454]